MGPLEEKVIELAKLENKLGVNEPVYKIKFISENVTGGKRKRTRRHKIIQRKMKTINSKTRRKIGNKKKDIKPLFHHY
jgi:hypothetical protein